jgi:hypothetical protein
VAGGALATDIAIHGAKLPLTEQTVAVSLGYPLSERLTLLAGAGALVSGALGAAGFSAGEVGFVGGSYRAVAPSDVVPLVAVAITLSVAHAGLGGDSFTSTDAKLSVTAAWPIAGIFAPYLSATVFGGPIFYRGDIGGDRYHYQALAGAAVALPLGFDLFVEGSPVGARVLSGGVGFTF